MNSNDEEIQLDRKFNRVAYIATAVLFGFALIVASPSNADDTSGVMGNIAVVEVNDDITVSIGGGVRADGNFEIKPDKTNDFAVDNARLTFGVDTSYGVSADVSAQYDGTATNNFDLLDAAVSLDLPIPFVGTVKGGRFIAPANRATLNDTYGQITWDLPTVVAKYPSINGYGRLDGGAVYGGVDHKISGVADATQGFLGDDFGVDYSVGVFQGINNADDALFATRIALDLGGIDLGFALQTQENAVVTSDYLGWNIDVAYAKKLGPGTVSVEGGVFQSDLDGAAYVPGVGLNEGLGGYVLGAYALEDFALKAGKLTVTPQPFVRYQNFQFDGANDGEQVRWDAGANLILDEATNTKLTVNYFNDELQGITNEGVLVGIQFAF
jgi:hypothetical protein